MAELLLHDLPPPAPWGAFPDAGFDAIVALAKRDYDLVLMDGRMPRMDGVAATLVYFIFGSILYSWIGGGIPAVKAFWRQAIEPSVTALGTCSSLGTLPVTLRAGKAMGINPDIVDVSIPLLVNLNKGGVAMIAALKIVFIYSVLGMEFTTETFFLTMLIAVLSAIIVGGVPGGAFLGEIFIVTTLGLPMEAIPMLVVLGTITDAPATLINVIHDLNAAQIVERFAGKKPAQAELKSTAAAV